MSSIKIPIFLDHPFPASFSFDKPLLLKPPLCLPEIPIVMWRNVARKVSSKIQPIQSPRHLVLCRNNTCSFLGFPQGSVFSNGVHVSSSKVLPFDPGYRKLAKSPITNELFGCPCLYNHRDQVEIKGLSSRNYATVAEAVVVSSTDVEDDVSVADEVQELLTHMKKEQSRQYFRIWRAKNKGHIMGRRKYQALKKRQVKIETEAWVQAAKEYKDLLKDMCDQKLAPNLPYMKTLFLGWFEPLCNKIAEEQELCKQGKTKVAYAKYFHQLPADMMAVITMHKLMGLLLTGGEHGSARVVQAACLVGDAIEQEVRIHNFLEKTKKKKVDNNEKVEGDPTPANIEEQEKLRKTVSNLLKKQKLRVVQAIVKAHDETQPWGTDAKAKVGGHLIDLLLQTAYIQSPDDQLLDCPPDVKPAFMHTSKTVPKDAKGASRRYGIIKCDPLVLKGLEKTARHMVIPYMPMLVPPVKWKGYDRGAHLYLPSYVMRTHGAKQQREAIIRTPKQQLIPVFEALDTLGRTRWRVNKQVLSVVEQIWANGGRLGELVDQDDIPLPEQPDTEDEALLRKWRWKVRNVKKENSERHSLRCDLELKLAVARKMKDEQYFFYPHNLDFRGRAYPMHPHLNHLGSDVCRGILEFAEGRPLGKAGLQWLKIHLANLFANGVDKLSQEARIAFTENHLDDIFDSAERPLEGRRWWLNAEDPFQFLASCINLSETLRSPSPEAMISHVPVHQDGSCNGLQHYAALGRDKLGAAAVNLVAGEKPADVYSGIAARVVDIMKRDAEKDPIAYPDAARARVLINQVDRKLVKQTVMTSVYGVTFIGARDQIKRRLKERGVIADDAEIFSAACYAAKITLTALGEMFEAARSIMTWLGDCAKIIASENQPVRWTTPLGLPVVQPYCKMGRHLVKTSLQVLSLKRETDKVLVKRQRTAFPPNFVHSLDGSHMMMTAVACRNANLNFAGVHDSYWTHACDVDELNKILREKFVELYEAPILENVCCLILAVFSGTTPNLLARHHSDIRPSNLELRFDGRNARRQESRILTQLLESFQTSFPTLSFPDLPERGDFDLREVLDSPYFFN